MFARLFLEHPRSIGESYLEHQRRAFGFGCSLFIAALACFVHGVVPALFVRTGSTAVTRLHDRMVAHRAGRAGDSRPADPGLMVHPGPPVPGRRPAAESISR